MNSFFLFLVPLLFCWLQTDFARGSKATIYSCFLIVKGILYFQQECPRYLSDAPKDNEYIYGLELLRNLSENKVYSFCYFQKENLELFFYRNTTQPRKYLSINEIILQRLQIFLNHLVNLYWFLYSCIYFWFFQMVFSHCFIPRVC